MVAELSKTYYDCRRAALIAASGLLLVSLPIPVDQRTGILLGLQIPGPADFVRVAAFIAASYLIAQFIFLWIYEAIPYSRARAGIEIELRDAFAHQLSQSDQLLQQLKSALSSIKQSIKIPEPIGTLNGESFIIDIPELSRRFENLVQEDRRHIHEQIKNRLRGELVERGYVVPDEPIESALAESSGGPSFIAEHVSGWLNMQIRPGAVLTDYGGFVHVKYMSARGLKDCSKRVKELSRELRKARRAFTYSPASRRAQLIVFDLAPPFALFLMGIWHLFLRALDHPPPWDLVNLSVSISKGLDRLIFW